MMALFYSIIVSIIAVNGCDDDILLTPEYMIGDTNGLPLENMADGSYSSYWRANNVGGEYVYFYYPAEVEVKWIFVQRYDLYATYFTVYDGSNNIAHQYFGDSTEYYDSVTIRFNDVHTDYLRFYFYYTSTVRISRLEVHGCYNTSTPTISPTTYVPTDVPTSFPTVSPTLVPVTTVPSEIPTVLPTTAPTVSPSIPNPSPYPTTAPSWSPTELPSVETVIPSPSPTFAPTMKMSTNHPSVAPSSSPTFEPTIAIQSPFPSMSPTASPTEPPTIVSTASGGFQITIGVIEIFLIVIVCLCGVLLVVFIRYRKAIRVNEGLHNAADKAYSVEDYMMQIRKTQNKGGFKVKQTGNTGCDVEDRGIQMNKIRHMVGEDSRREAKDNHVATRTRNIIGEDSRQEAKDHNVDIRFALDKVSSDNCEVFNREGDLEIGPQDSAL